MQLRVFLIFRKIADIRYFSCVIRCFIVRIRYLLPKRAVLLGNLLLNPKKWHFRIFIFMGVWLRRHPITTSTTNTQTL